MNFQKISIITPSFNQGLYIEQTIDSVLSQNYPNLEYVVIDGDSTDNSVEIIKKYEKHLSYWVSEKDKGQSQAINKGLAKCSGEIFNWLCSDDYLEEGTLAEINKIFIETSARIVSGKFRLINEADMNNPVVLDGIQLDKTAEKAFARCAMTQPATFWRIEDIRKFCGINERLHYFMDLELLLKYLLHFGLNGIENTDKILANYLLHPESKSFKEMDNSKIKPDSAFNIEKNNMFYFLAKKYGMSKKILDTIKKLMNNVDEDYVMECIPEKPVIDIKKTINYYLYDFLRRHFYSVNFNSAWQIAWGIEKRYLDYEERKGLRYIKKNLLLKRICNYE